MAPFSVIIPAHNEAAVIARCLAALLGGAPAGAEPEIIVAANGCQDATVALARAAAPSATVLDLPVGSKVIAMNEANALAQAFPRFFLDADIVCDYRALAATAEALRQPGTLAASPALHMDTSGCDHWVQSYYKVWLHLPYVTDRLVAGVIGLSEAGMARVGHFPPVMADDLYVRTRFSREERATVRHDSAGNPTSFTVVPPQTLAAMVRIEARRRVGNEQVHALYPVPGDNRINRPGDLRLARAAGASWWDIAVYLGIKIGARALLRWRKWRGTAQVWTKDDSSRQG